MGIQQIYDTAANLTSANPTLAGGEMGIESDEGGVKIGDGTTAWTSLDYHTPKFTQQFVWVSGYEMEASYGSPTFTVSGATDTAELHTWRLSATAGEGMAFTTMLPHHWNEFATYVWWSCPDANSGNIVIQLWWAEMEEGDLISEAAAGAGSTRATVTTTDEMIRSLAGPTTNSIVGGVPFRGVILRAGADAADTYGSDIWLHGVELRRTS